MNDDREFLFLRLLHPEKSWDDVLAKLETARDGEGVEDPLIRAGELLSRKNTMVCGARATLEVELEDSMSAKGYSKRATRLALLKTGFNTAEAFRWLEHCGKIPSLENIVYDTDEDSEVPPPPPPDWSGVSECEDALSPRSPTHQQTSTTSNPSIPHTLPEKHGSKIEQTEKFGGEQRGGTKIWSFEEISPGTIATEEKMKRILMKELWRAISKLKLSTIYAEISRLKKLSQGDTVSQIPTQRIRQTSFASNDPYVRRRSIFRDQAQPELGASTHSWEEKRDFLQVKEDRRRARRQRRVITSGRGASGRPWEEKSNHLQVLEDSRHVCCQRQVLTSGGGASGGFWEENRNVIRDKDNRRSVCPQRRVVTSGGGLPFGYPRHPKMESYVHRVER